MNAIEDEIEPAEEPSAPPDEQSEPVYQNADAETSFAGQKWFDRKKTLLIICAGLIAVVVLGLLFSGPKSKKKTAEEETGGSAAEASGDFLRRELEKKPEAAPPNQTGGEPLPETAVDVPAAPYPEVTFIRPNQPERETAPPQAPGAAPPPFTAPASPMVPPVEGSIWGGQARGQISAVPGTGGGGGMGNNYAEMFPYLTQGAGGAGGGVAGGAAGAPGGAGTALTPYAAQNNQADKMAFYGQPNKSIAAATGTFLADNAIWVGTVIPAILQTAINTDLPGSVVARVTSNVYNSRSGRYLLIPQGSLLVARYNSSVSYAQKRAQIVWDTLVRPDGYEMNLDGMNGVDRLGMAGIEAAYHENWFEYLKAAGLIALFSVANAKMAGEAAKYADNNTAAALTQGNAAFVQQMSDKIVERAMNIQPTLIVEAGEKINIMTNRTVYLPPLADYKTTQKYIR